MADRHGQYRGRFAPSPTGLLHAGSLVTALASWLDARLHQGVWLIRIEDVDSTRCKPHWSEGILWQLQCCGLRSDEPVLKQNQGGERYQRALHQLQRMGAAYGCTCSRQEMRRHTDVLRPDVYSGACRHKLPHSNENPHIKSAISGKEHSSPMILVAEKTAAETSFNPVFKPRPMAWRVRCGEGAEEAPLVWVDERLGEHSQQLWQEVGDFVVRRADGCWAYQLAVVVDDAFQGVTHIVRGEDLLDNTPRQIHLQHLLGYARPRYWHVPVVLADDGQKLSKQTGAQALQLDTPQHVLAALHQAGVALGLNLPQPHPSLGVAEWLQQAVLAWGQVRWVRNGCGYGLE